MRGCLRGLLQFIAVCIVAVCVAVFALGYQLPTEINGFRLPSFDASSLESTIESIVPGGSSASSKSQSVTIPRTTDLSSAPSYNCKVTKKNLLKLVKATDADAYVILKSQSDAGDDFKQWLKGNDRLVDAVDTTVHEEFHSYTYATGGYTVSGNKALPIERYYLGNGKTRDVAETQTFKTNEATSSIPKRYQTFRYDRYVSKTATVTANQNGVYGLLNEFSAYYWGMHASWSLYPYLQQNASSYDGYTSFVSSYENGRDAYAEFYYWTLVYLDYARQHQPQVYEQILANKAYVKTFTGMQKKYRRLIKAYGQDVDEVNANYPSAMRVTSAGSYNTLAGQLSSDEYRTVRQALKEAAR